MGIWQCSSNLKTRKKIQERCDFLLPGVPKYQGSPAFLKEAIFKNLGNCKQFIYILGDISDLRCSLLEMRNVFLGNAFK